MKKKIRETLLKSGAVAVGFAKAGEIDGDANEAFEKWIGEGFHGEISYLERHLPLRKHTDNILPGANTVISIAFSYAPEKWREETKSYIASYAYGEDYHFYLREKLKPIVESFKGEYGGNWRICIDSAPMAERYWALKSGIGKRGLNGAIIVEGCGTLGFLVEILTTNLISPDTPSKEVCDRCGKCVDLCPTKALRGDGTMDARKCINYLTIEKKGEFSEEETKMVSSANGYLFGCDRCLRVCPHNQEISHTKGAINFSNGDLMELGCEDILSIGAQEFKRKFTRTPLAYAGYEKLRRNALAIKTKGIEIL
ncbi:MAG: tRNA epoxyqueuosine(34) reductase QueG [Muribaculaceae bacterium]|nr:tRNA epoxyqueuosine(34) reductase QueG [Muribaculaceae bacterium]